MPSRYTLCVLLFLVLLVLLVLADFPKMKKVRIDIAPKFGVQDREVHVDIRFDADNRLRNDVNDESLLDCVNYNCAMAQAALKDQGLKGVWRANVAILDRVVEFYKNKKHEAA